MKDKKQEKKEIEESNTKNNEMVKEMSKPMPKEITPEILTKMPKETPDKLPEQKDPLAEMTELLKRTQANFENYRKQQEKRIEEIRAFAAKDVILQLLPIIDNFELALKNTKCEKNEFIQGIELIYSQLHSFLGNNNIQVIETKNKLFNPCYHEALMRAESELPVNTILEELQKGFTLHDKVIRHAKVTISTGKKEVNKTNINGGK